MSSDLRLRLWMQVAGSIAVALAHAACVSDVDSPPPDSAQASAGSGGSAGNSSASAGSGGSNANSAGAGGGSSTYESDPTFAMGVHCPMVTQALLTDFSPPAPAAVASADAGADAGAADAGAPAPGASTGITFGDFTNTLSGSSFTYPGDGDYAVHSDVSGGNWHLTGTLGNYSGFGIVFVGCSLVDASAYQGISFTVRGNVPMGNTITLSVGTAADEISHVWLNRNAMPVPNPPAATNSGRCIPAMGQYDGTCGAPTFAVPVTAEVATVNVTWAQLLGGRPAASVTPSEITNINWTFPAPVGAGTPTPTTYAVDITIDDLRFIGTP